MDCCRRSGVSNIPYYEPETQSKNTYAQRAPSVERHLPQDGERLDDNQGQGSLANYYAVARGWKIGIYDSWEGPGGAKEQTDRFSGVRHKKFDDRESAIRYLENQGIPRSDIRIFRAAFKQLENFKPDATAPFLVELKRYMDSLNMSRENRGIAKVDAIRASLIQYLLPEGVPVDQEDEEEGIILSDDQTLELCQNMCYETGRAPGGTIDECLMALKASPYINIVDFVDTCRTGRSLRAFHNWDLFCDYTMQPGKTIWLAYAKTNEILAPLLQDLQNGPHSVDPRSTRRELLRGLSHRLSLRGINLRETFNVTVPGERSNPRALQAIEPTTSDRRQDASTTTRNTHATSSKTNPSVNPTPKPGPFRQTTLRFPSGASSSTQPSTQHAEETKTYTSNRSPKSSPADAPTHLHQALAQRADANTYKLKKNPLYLLASARALRHRTCPGRGRRGRLSWSLWRCDQGRDGKGTGWAGVFLFFSSFFCFCIRSWSHGTMFSGRGCITMRLCADKQLRRCFLFFLFVLIASGNTLVSHSSCNVLLTCSPANVQAHIPSTPHQHTHTSPIATAQHIQPFP